MSGVKCSKPNCKGWAKRGTTRCVFHPLDMAAPVARATPSSAPTARCNVCRSPIPEGRAGCPNPWMHNPGYTPRSRS